MPVLLQIDEEVKIRLPQTPPNASKMTQALLVSGFVIASCGLIYELIASTLASYLLGDSVTQFSTVIGAYLFAMGIGSWLSRYVVKGFIHSPKVRIINTDAFRWLAENSEVFDFIVVDFPDPTHYSLGKLYSNVFYRLLKNHLAAHGAAAIQVTSLLYKFFIKTLLLHE